MKASEFIMNYLTELINGENNLSPDAIHETPVDVDWSEAFEQERAEIVYLNVESWDYQECIAWLIDHGCHDEKIYPDFEEKNIDQLIEYLLNDAHIDEDEKQEFYSTTFHSGTEMRRCLYEKYINEIIDDLIDDLREEIQERIQDELSQYEPVMNYAYPLPIPGYWDDSLEELQNKIEGICLTIVRLDGAPYLALTGGGMNLSWEICEAYILLGFLPPYHFCDLPKMCGRGKSERDKAILFACKSTCDLISNWALSTKQRLDKLEQWSKEH